MNKSEVRKNKFFTKRIQDRCIVLEADFWNEEVYVDFYASKRIVSGSSQTESANECLADMKQFVSVICDMIIEARAFYYDNNESFDSFTFVVVSR
jgi:hypothetical protein